MISSQLHLLNQRIQDQLKVTLSLHRSNSITERRSIHNMEDFLLAITVFQKAASIAAGTVQGASEQGEGHDDGTGYHESSSMISRMSTLKRHEIANILQCNETEGQMSTLPTAVRVDEAEETKSPLDGPQSLVPTFNLTAIFSDGFGQLAHKAIQDLDFRGAETFLRRAMEHHISTGLDDVEHRRLRKQLSLSLFLQGRDKEAKSLVLDLAEHTGDDFNTTSQLVFVLALSLAHELEFNQAREICEHLCQILCISSDVYSDALSENDIFLLLVTCYRQSGDWMSARAILAKFPDIDEDQCLPSPLEFILGSDDLLLELLSDSSSESRTVPSLFISQAQSLPIAQRVTPLQERLDAASIFTTRFAASEIGDDDDHGVVRTKYNRPSSAPSGDSKQAVQNKSRGPYSFRSKYPRLSALKQLDLKARPHPSFQLLQWQRCTADVNRIAPSRDIIAWVEGQAANNETIPAAERLFDHVEYSLALSSFTGPGPLVAEPDAGAIKNAAILEQTEAQSGARYPLFSNSPCLR